MSIEKLEEVYSNNVTEILQTIGNNAAAFSQFLGSQSLDIAILNMEAYLIMLKGLRDEMTDTTVSTTTNNTLLATPLLNDSMMIHKTRLSRSSKSRLTIMRTSPDACRQIEVDRDATMAPTPIDMSNTMILEDSTFIDATRQMDESANEQGFMADVSSNNETCRSRHPSFNFGSISSVQESAIPSTFEFEHETPVFAEMLRGANNDMSVMVIEKTPKARKSIELLVTPPNVWNIKLRPGSNRKISEEIRKEVQRQLEEEEKDVNE